MNKFYIGEATSGENGEQSLVAQFLSFSAEIVRVHLFDLNFSDYYVLVIWSIEMPSFHYPKNVYIIVI